MGSREATGNRAAAFGALWVAVAACLYFYANRGADYGGFIANLWEYGPWALKQITAPGLLHAIGCCAATGAYFLAMHEAGRILCRGADLNDHAPFLTTAMNIAAGAILYSLLYLALGLAGLLYGAVFYAILIPPLVSALWRLLKDRGAAREPAAQISWFSVAIVVLLCLYALAALAHTLTPPTAADALMYHLAVPELYLKSHRIYYIPFILHANWPQGAEMHFMAGLSLGGADFARMMNFGFIVLAALAAGGAAQRFSGNRGGAAAAVVFLSMPLASIHFHYVNVEPLLAVYTVLAVALLPKGDEQHAVRRAVLCGFFCGAAVGVKLSGGILAALAMVLLLFRLRKSEHRRRAFTAFLLAAMVPALPWLIRSWVWTGNPVWPFMYSLIGGANWSAENARDYMFFMREWPGLVPVRGAAAAGDLLTNVWQDNAGVALPVLAGLLVTAGAAVRRGAGIPAVAAAVLLAAWCAATPQPRLVLPALALACAACGGLFDKKSVVPRIALVLALAFQVAVFTSVALRHVPCALGHQTDAEYLAGQDLHHVYEFADRQLPENARLLLMWDARGFACPRNYLWGDPLDQGYIHYSEFDTPGKLQARLRAEGITHVLFHAPGLAAKRDLDMALRRAHHIGEQQNTNIRAAAMLENALIRARAWRPVYVSPARKYTLMEIHYKTAPAVD